MSERDRLPRCPGGHQCTCCWEGCDCGCVSACPVYRYWDKKYVPPPKISEVKRMAELQAENARLREAEASYD